MKSKFFIILLLLLAISAFQLPTKIKADRVTANISFDSEQGSFTPDHINANQGDTVIINFSIPTNDTYCCGIQISGANGEFDTGTISKGTSQQVTFTANSAFIFTAYWQGIRTVKATGSVDVITPTHSAAYVTPPVQQPGLNQTVPSVVPTETSIGPSVPEGLYVQIIGPTQIDVSWLTAKGATSYEVYRDDKLISTVSTLFFNDSNLTADTTYTYKVKAKYSDLTSDFSMPITGKTLENSKTGTMFIDLTQNYVSIDKIVYPYGQVPDINRGSDFNIFGRTEANANVTITVNSNSDVYNIVANNDGNWNIKIDASKFDIGDHAFQVSVASQNTARFSQQNPFHFKVILENPNSYLVSQIRNNWTLIALIIIVAIAFLIFLKKRKPETVKTS